MQLQSGSFLQGGKYKIESILGQGGFGITYQALQTGLNRQVAIKEFFMKDYCERNEKTSHIIMGTQSSRELVERFRQEFIKEANGKDIRCFVIDGKVVAAIQREAMPGEFRANIHLGGTASIIKVTAEEKRIAIKATKAMDLKVAGVDIIRSSKGPLLLEVNSSPGLEGIESATNKDIAGEMIKAIEKNFKLK